MAGYQTTYFTKRINYESVGFQKLKIHLTNFRNNFKFFKFSKFLKILDLFEIFEISCINTPNI